MKETRKPKRRKRDRQGNRMALIGIVFVIFSMALVVNARSSSLRAKDLEYQVREENLRAQVEEEKKRSQSYEALFSAYTAMQQEDLDTAALQIQNVYVDTLSDSAKGVYNTICERTGVSGISSSDSTDSTGDSSTDSTGSTDNAEGADSTQSAQGDSGNYDDSGDYSDEYSSYDESGYDDSSYNDGYTE